jgi:hypothetical protein
MPEKLMLDSDLAYLYQVPTKALNQVVKRNPNRFRVSANAHAWQDKL